MLRTDLPEIIIDTLPGPKAEALIERRNQAIPSAIRCGYPVVIERGEGAMIQDVDGNKFLDWIGGVGVLNIGYSQPEVVEAVKEQAEKYFHGMFNIVTHEGYVALAEKLAQIAPVRGDKKKVFFANSGAEADENKEPAPELTSEIIQACAKMGLLVEGAGTYNNVIRFLAPLVMTDEQLEAGLDIFEKAIAGCL